MRIASYPHLFSPLSIFLFLFILSSTLSPSSSYSFSSPFSTPPSFPPQRNIQMIGKLSPTRCLLRLSSSSSSSSSSFHRCYSTTLPTTSPSFASQSPLPITAMDRRDLVKQTGGLRRLPVVKPSNEIISTATNTAFKTLKPDKTIKNSRQRARKHAAEKLDGLTKLLCLPLRTCVEGYKRELKSLHPFEKVVADLTARARQKKDGLTLIDVLGEINEARKLVLSRGKEYAAAAKNSTTSKEAAEIIEAGEKELVELFTIHAAPPIDSLLQLQKSLRTTPAVRLDTPAVVLVGAPNVGKSSIVRAISSGTPEVNNYPFTTRGMTLGHVKTRWAHKGYDELCQVMDSPGLLLREDSKRNEMESLTLAAMQHLPTAVMYVMDLSGEAGEACSSVYDQLQLRRETRARFPRRPWIDVIAKFDLGVVDGAKEELREIVGEGGKIVELSIHQNIGVDELKGECFRMLDQVRVVLDAMEIAAEEEREEMERLRD